MDVRGEFGLGTAEGICILIGKGQISWHSN